MIKAPEGWTQPAAPINWNTTKMDDVKIIIDKGGRWNFLVRS